MASWASRRDGHSLPFWNHIITADGFFVFRRLKVGSRSSFAPERKAVGCSSTMMVQYAYLGGMKELSYL